MPEERPDPRLSKPAVARFGVYEVNLRTGELRKHGKNLKLEQIQEQYLKLYPGSRVPEGRSLARTLRRKDVRHHFNKRGAPRKLGDKRR